MNPEEQLPKRSTLWFSEEEKTTTSAKVLDKITVIFAIFLATFSLVVFWRIISKIDFEEAFFTPLTPFLIAVGKSFNINANQSIRILFISSFIISILGVYFLVRDLTKRYLPAILSAIIYLIPPIPIFVLSFLRIGLLEKELASAKSFFTIVYGDGANFMALALVPFATLFFLRFLKGAKKADLVVTVCFSVLILLANRSQALSLVLVLTVCLVTDSLLGLAREKFKRYLMVLILSAGLVSFWYTPYFWLQGLMLFGNQFIKNIKFLFPLPFITAVLTLLFAFVFFARNEKRQAIVITFLVFVVFSGILFDWFVNSHSFVPHPHRMFASVIMFGSVLMALLITHVIDWSNITRRLKVEEWSAYGRALTAIILGFVSLIALSLVAYIFSPLAIMAIAGPKGIWTKVRLNVIADRQETLNLAGGNFHLVHQNIDKWQIWLGMITTLLFLAILTYLVFKAVTQEEAENDR